MKLGLVLTNDWELFGDGSGDYFELQHNPMNDLLDLITAQNAKITIMAEVGQQFAHQENINNYPEFEKICLGWEEIVQKAVKTGNDVQLHYHSQWQGAEYKNGEWHLNMDRWSLPSLSSEEIELNLTKGKEYLDELLKPINNKYSCDVFRAGALCIQPSEKPIEKLIKTGFKADSSVTQGEFSPGFYDFRNAYSNVIPWYTSKDITQLGDREEGILEIPIYTFSGLDSSAMKKYMPGIYYSIKFGKSVSAESLQWQDERESVKETRYPRSKRFYKKNQKKNFNFYMKAILSQSHFHLDYDFLPPEVFVKILKNIINENVKKFNNDLILPVVALGHIKDIPNTKNIEKILKLIKNELADQVIFWTMSDAVNYWQDKAHTKERKLS
jgi:hypothetical protein